jgi:DNA-binding FadR family transcriptional regulator
MSHHSEPATPLVSPVSDAVFGPVRQGNAFEETVERLLQAIRLGVVGPGERFPPERELAARLGVSRVTLADAIRALQENGYVESQRGRYGGTFVKARRLRPSRAAARRLARNMGARLNDALVLREVLEAGAADVAAATDLGSEARAYLEARLDDTNAASLNDYRRCDTRLHLAIAEVAGSPSLTSAVAQVRTRLNELLDAIPLLERNLEHSNDQHAEVVDAILAGDREAARRAILEHLDGTAALLRGFLT